tara:strand:+ start:1381 stop:1662 length:282 start_codon:yes stop_codon:yes gene_type:complete
MAYASGKNSKGICDRCGLTFRYEELLFEIENQRRNGLKVCSSCLDKDHPQLRLGEEKIDDPQSLRDPRPDHDEVATVNTAFNNRYPHTAGVTS